MHLLTFFVPGVYENPLTAAGRARTIAAFHLAQGNIDVISKSEMRRDVLAALMSSRAVGYWLNEKGWLEKNRKVGKFQLVRLTGDGLRTCANSLAGGSSVPTTPALVTARREKMLRGRNGLSQKSFPPLPTEA